MRISRDRWIASRGFCEGFGVQGVRLVVLVLQSSEGNSLNPKH